MKHIQRDTVFAPYVNEYLSRKQLAKIGYTSSIDDLEDYKGELFVQIGLMFDRLKKEELDKAKKVKHGRK
jgi:hypothetical protein